MSQDGNAFYTIRSATAWRPFENVKLAALPAQAPLGSVQDVAIGLFNQGLPAGQWQLVIVALSNPTCYTIRSSQPVLWQNVLPFFGGSQWKPWTNLETDTSYTDGGSFRVASVAWRPLLP